MRRQIRAALPVMWIVAGRTAGLVTAGRKSVTRAVDTKPI